MQYLTNVGLFSKSIIGAVVVLAGFSSVTVPAFGRYSGTGNLPNDSPRPAPVAAPAAVAAPAPAAVVAVTSSDVRIQILTTYATAVAAAQAKVDAAKAAHDAAVKALADVRKLADVHKAEKALQDAAQDTTKEATDGISDLKEKDKASKDYVDGWKAYIDGQEKAEAALSAAGQLPALAKGEELRAQELDAAYKQLEGATLLLEDKRNGFIAEDAAVYQAADAADKAAKAQAAANAQHAADVRKDIQGAIDHQLDKPMREIDRNTHDFDKGMDRYHTS